MGRPRVHVSVRTAAEGLKVEIFIAPSLLQQVAEADGRIGWSGPRGENSLVLSLHDMPHQRHLEYGLAELVFSPGPEDWGDEDPPDFEDGKDWLVPPR